ncbi:uncharacterized protein LOC129224827 [Uloborus diversus]|uniref:uncharacterized protein LOC129224827 n=1 Tax=Uloborus diversus TaxID=327109 RepID=UPI00240A9A62|nr:uncharacterized protein LOC129224827 [Uloborus diversus]
MAIAEGPDGTAAWIVAFAAFVINFIMAGIFRVGGILFVAIMERYGTDRKSASMPFSVRSSIRNLAGPAVGILGAKYGAPPVIIAGGISGVLSAAACFYVSNVTGLIIVWGLINGISSSLITVLPQVVIGQYFQKYRTTASGISYSGACVASFIFPVVIEESLSHYGLEGTFVIVAAIIMNTIPAAMILKKPPWLEEDSVKNKNLNLKVSVSEKATNGSTDQKTFVDLKIKYFNDQIYENINFSEQLKFLIRDINVSYLIENEDLMRQLLTMKVCSKTTKKLEDEPDDEYFSNSYRTTAIDHLLTLIQSNGLDRGTLQSNTSTLVPALKENENGHCLTTNLKESQFKFNVCHKKAYGAQDKTEYNLNTITTNKVPYSNVRYNEIVIELLEQVCTKNESEIAENFSSADKKRILKTCEELRKLYNACVNLANKGSVPEAKLTAPGNPIPEKNKCDTSKKSSFYHFKTALKLYTKPIYLLICFSRMIFFVTFSSVVTTIVDFAMDKGLPEEDGKFIIAAIAFGDLLGRMCTGWITDRGFLKLHVYIMIVMVVQGFSTFSLCFVSSRIPFLIAVGFFSLLQGSLFVRHPVLVIKYVDKENHAVAMGSIDFFSSFVGFLLPVYIGFFRDTIGSYNYIMYINGAVGSLLGFFWIMEPYLNKKSTPAETNEGKV